MDTVFLQARYDKLKTRIENLEDAIMALESGSIQMYTLNTGQGSQTVTYNNLAMLRTNLQSAMNMLNTIKMRLDGTSHCARPGW